MNHKEQERIEEIEPAEQQTPVTEADTGTEDSAQTVEQTAQYNGRESAQAAEEAEADAIETVVAEEATLESPEEIIAQLETELAEARARSDQYLDQMQRTAAEFQNTRRRQERQLQESIERATDSLIRRLLPVLDDFDLAFSNVPPTLENEKVAWVEGFQRIHQKLFSLLGEEGLTPIERTGPFDPNRHEAVTNEPHDEIESGHIIETLRTGYEYRGRVLRPALVRVAQ